MTDSIFLESLNSMNAKFKRLRSLLLFLLFMSININAESEDNQTNITAQQSENQIEQMLLEVVQEQKKNTRNFLPPVKKRPTLTKSKVILQIMQPPEIETRKIKIQNIAIVNSNDAKLSEKISQFQIGYAPIPGKTLKLTKDEILKRAKMGFPLVDFSIIGDNQISIMRKASHIQKSQQIEIIKEFEATNLKAENFELEIFTPLSDLFLEGENLNYQVEYFGKVPNSNFRNWQISFFSEGSVLKKLLIRGKVSVINVKKSLASNLQNKEIDSSTATKILAEDFKNFIVKHANKGKLKQADDILIPTTGTTKDLVAANIKKQPLVKKGSLVNLSHQTQNFLLSTSALALEDGYLGDFIQVLNKHSKKTISAQVTAKSEVKTFNTAN